MQIAIVGLGITTTAVGKALKNTSDDFAIMGHDPDEELVKRAKQVSAIDDSHWNLPTACEGADLVILAVPLAELERSLEAIAPDLGKNTVIIDLGLLKRPAWALAQDILGDAATRFIGCSLLLPNASMDRLENLTDLPGKVIFRIAAEPTTASRTLDMASNLAAAIGADIEYIDPSEQDGLIAATVQLPYLCAVGLTNVLAEKDGIQERSRAMGSECLALANLLLANRTISVNGLLENAENLRHWISREIAELQTLLNLLEREEQVALQNSVARASETAKKWSGTDCLAQESETDEPRPGGFWRQMFLGGLADRRDDR